MLNLVKKKGMLAIPEVRLLLPDVFSVIKYELMIMWNVSEMLQPAYRKGQHMNPGDNNTIIFLSRNMWSSKSPTRANTVGLPGGFLSIQPLKVGWTHSQQHSGLSVHQHNMRRDGSLPNAEQHKTHGSSADCPSQNVILSFYYDAGNVTSTTPAHLCW